MATHHDPKDLGWYYRETDTADGNEQTAAHGCGMTANDEMKLHWRVTPHGCTRLIEEPALDLPVVTRARG